MSGSGDDDSDGKKGETPRTSPPANPPAAPGFSRTTGTFPRATVSPPRRPTPPPMQSPVQSLSMLPPEPHDDHNAARGAKNVITRCLAVTAGEQVHVLTFRADSLYGLIAQTIEEAGATPVRVELDTIEPKASTPQDYINLISRHLSGATATILLAPVRPSAALSLAVAKAAEGARSRHLHLLQVDERLLGQSVRADPELLAIVNGRLSGAIQPPAVVRVTSDAGTDLEIQLAPKHPIIASSGRPGPGQSENLPAGSVFTHPARVHGTLVVDRAIFGPGLSLDRSAVRRAPARFVFNGGRVSDHETTDVAVREAVDNYLESHAYASSVGLVVFPTNYLVRSEVGIDRQDMLLPGMCVSLGYSSSDVTRAAFDAPVQLALLGRKQNVEVNGRRLVDGGRFARDLVEGIDPFR